jgi:hypothetical protein
MAANIQEAMAEVKRKSALIALYVDDPTILAIIGDNTTVVAEVAVYDVSGAAVACLRYARGVIPTQKRIGDVQVYLEGIDATIASLSPGGNVPLTRPVYLYGEDITDELT